MVHDYGDTFLQAPEGYKSDSRQPGLKKKRSLNRAKIIKMDRGHLAIMK
jgi:hypothetical protein